MAISSASPATAAAPRARGWHVRPSFALIPLFAMVLVGTFFAFDRTGFYDPLWLVLVGNAVFITGSSLLIAYIARRNYRATGRISLLLLGSGVLAFGIAAAIAALVRTRPDGANLNVTIYNAGALIGALFHATAAFLALAGVAPEVGSRHRRSWLVVGYCGPTLVVVLLLALCLAGAVPAFFVQGVGPTSLRQWVLGIAAVLFASSSAVLFGTYVRTRERFLYWYAGALSLTAISLTAFLVQRAVGSPVGWIGRLAQYVGAAYFVGALVVAARSAQSRRTSLDHVLTTSLSGAEESFRALAENVPDVIRRFDRDLNHVYVNVAGQRLYGKPAGTIVGKRMEHAGVAPEQARVWNERIEEVFRTGRRIEVEEYLSTAGGVGYFQSQCVPEYGPDGGVANVLVVSRDLTERRRAEEAVRRSEARYRSLFESMTEGFATHELITDPSGRAIDYRFLEVNPAFERLTGLKREDLVGRTFREALAGDDPRWVEEYGRVVLTGVPAQFENYSPVLRRHYEVFAFRYAPMQFGVVFMDVTERKLVQDALAGAKAAAEEANRQKDHFLAVLSHELRNPLAPIANSIHVLDRVEPGSEQARRARAVIARQAAQLTRLVDDLLDVTRLSRNKIQLRRDRLELRELVHSTVEDHRSVFDAGGVRLEVQLPDQPVHVDADRHRLAQIIGNLLQNASKFTGPGGVTTVAVSVEAPGPAAVIRVRDTGVGMAPEMLARVFEPFVQADTTLDRSKGGLGLGLALVKGLVELHGGEVAAHSAGPGLGSELVVRLPLVAEELRALPATVPGPSHGSHAA